MAEVENLYEIYQKRKYLALCLAGCLMFVVIALFFIFNTDFLTQYCQQNPFKLCPRNPFSYYFIGGISFFFFGILCLGFSPLIPDLIKPRKIFHMNDKGFYSDLCGFVEWKAVSNLSLFEFSSSKFICFDSEYYDDILSKLSTCSRILQKINKPFIGYDFYISFSGSGVNVEEVFKEMRKYHERNN